MARLRVTIGSGNVGIVKLSGSNSYNGGTTINGGTLQLSGGGTTGSSSGPVTINAGTFDLNGDNVNTTRTIGALNGAAGTFVVNNNSGFYFTSLVIGQGNGDGSYAGSITDHNGTGNGFIGVTKTGTGQETFSGSNPYTFGTTINAGTLKLANTGGQALSGTGSVTINNGTLLFGANNQINPSAPIVLGSASGGSAIINSNGTSQGTGGNPAVPLSGTVGLGALTLNTSSVIDMSGTSVLHFANSSSQPIGQGHFPSMTGMACQLTGGGSEQILFGGDPSG